MNRRGAAVYHAPVTPGQLQIRRATVDDLPALRALWQGAGLSAPELENRLTDFHVVESEGEFAGALGVQVLRQHARLHSEDYANFAVADSARQLFWDRIQVIAANLGVFRIWTQETSPFWTHWGFQPAAPEVLSKLPEEWKSLEGRWLTLQLKDEEAINQVIQSQLAGLMEEEKKQTARVVGQARILRLLVTIAGFAIFFLCLALAAFLFMHRQMPPH